MKIRRENKRHLPSILLVKKKIQGRNFCIWGEKM